MQYFIRITLLKQTCIALFNGPWSISQVAMSLLQNENFLWIKNWSK